MFNSISGTITEKLPQLVRVETGGVEWNLTVSDVSLDQLPHVGNTARVFTYLVHKDDAMKLYGFATEAERSLFLDLLKVDGIGPKGAMKILSGSSVDTFVDALDSGDVAQLGRLPGVSQKMAQKMLLALKDKLTLLDAPLSSLARRPEKQSPWNDVIVALADMGYDRRKVDETVTRIATELGADAAAGGAERAQKEDEIFRRAIVELAS